MITGMIVAMMVILGYKLVIDWLWKKNNWTMAVATWALSIASGWLAGTGSASML